MYLVVVKKPWRSERYRSCSCGYYPFAHLAFGGVTFAAQPQDHSQKVNRKMYRAALRSIMSELARQDRWLSLRVWIWKQPKTKLLVQQVG